MPWLCHPQEHHDMNIEELCLQKDEGGWSFVIFADGVKMIGFVKTKMLANNESRSSVFHFKKSKDVLMKR